MSTNDNSLNSPDDFIVPSYTSEQSIQMANNLMVSQEIQTENHAFYFTQESGHQYSAATNNRTHETSQANHSFLPRTYPLYQDHREGVYGQFDGLPVDPARLHQNLHRDYHDQINQHQDVHGRSSYTNHTRNWRPQSQIQPQHTNNQQERERYTEFQQSVAHGNSYTASIPVSAKQAFSSRYAPASEVNPTYRPAREFHSLTLASMVEDDEGNEEENGDGVSDNGDQDGSKEDKFVVRGNQLDGRNIEGPEYGSLIKSIKHLKEVQAVLMAGHDVDLDSIPVDALTDLDTIMLPLVKELCESVINTTNITDQITATGGLSVPVKYMLSIKPLYIELACWDRVMSAYTSEGSHAIFDHRMFIKSNKTVPPEQFDTWQERVADFSRCCRLSKAYCKKFLIPNVAERLLQNPRNEFKLVLRSITNNTSKKAAADAGKRALKSVKKRKAEVEARNEEEDEDVLASDISQHMNKSKKAKKTDEPNNAGTRRPRASAPAKMSIPPQPKESLQNETQTTLAQASPYSTEMVSMSSIPHGNMAYGGPFAHTNNARMKLEHSRGNMEINFHDPNGLVIGFGGEMTGNTGIDNRGYYYPYLQPGFEDAASEATDDFAPAEDEY